MVQHESLQNSPLCPLASDATPGYAAAMNSRLFLALVVSVLAHVFFVAGLWLLPRFSSPPQPTPRIRGDSLVTVRVEGWSRPQVGRTPRPSRTDEVAIPVDVQPVLGSLPTPGPDTGTGQIQPIGYRPGGEEVSTGASWFPGTALARRVVFVVDHSVSMGLSGGLQRARAELKTALQSLPPDARFQILAYNQSARPLLVGGLVLATPDTRDRASALLEDLVAEGKTNHGAALRDALYLRPEVIYLITDADDLPDAPKVVVGTTTIHVIELGRGTGQGEGPLARLARATGGSYRRVAALR